MVIYYFRSMPTTSTKLGAHYSGNLPYQIFHNFKILDY